MTNTYEIINPSDCVTLESDDELAAVAATVLLGRGAYGLVRTGDGERVCPVMLFGGADEWLAEKFGGDFGAWLDDNASAVADVLDTAMCCSAAERAALVAALAGLPDDEQRQRRAAYNDEARTSLNDICGAAATWARRLRND